MGGYDPSLAPEAYTDGASGTADFIVRGEGELTFRELLEALEAGRTTTTSAGSPSAAPSGFQANPDRPSGGSKTASCARRNGRPASSTATRSWAGRST